MDTTTADTIARFSAELPRAEQIASIRLIEAQAALAYWSAWRTLPITFPKNDIARIPAHWLNFGARISPLTGSPRLSVNPPNAILNYLYAVLEPEARLAAAALGLDPGLGVLHVDSGNRDSMALDLLEPVRPQVDSYLLDWITRQPLSRECEMETVALWVRLQFGSPRRLRCGDGLSRPSRSGLRKRYGTHTRDRPGPSSSCQLALLTAGEVKDGETTSGCKPAQCLAKRKSAKSVALRGSRIGTAAHAPLRRRDKQWHRLRCSGMPGLRAKRPDHTFQRC